MLRGCILRGSCMVLREWIALALLAGVVWIVVGEVRSWYRS